MKDYFTKKEQVVILIIVFIIMIGLGFKIFVKAKLKSEEEDGLEIINSIEEDQSIDNNNDTDIEIDNNNNSKDEININNDIMVHISGQVKNPGLIELKLDNRVIDAVESAGGLKEDADLDRINLSKKLVDEEKIYIPKIGEEDLPNEVESTQSTNSDSGESNDKININNCTKEELISLPGIGDITADKILEYREENSFNTVEDIMNVSGIGDKKFEDIKDMIITN
ncbi:MAG TPA: helix-hairpin-helix domain-containing protein [Tissierellaceae bacterium]|nr:helix-hairpin-helix domain-containing protein [Tissierellaceae bacterium]